MRTSSINPSSHSWRALAAVFVLLGTTAPSRPAAAQTVGGARDASTAVEEAHNHFALGVKLYTEGDFGPALVQFQRAQEIKPHYKVLYNIAQCSFQLRDYAATRAALLRYLENGGSAIEPQRRSEVESELVDLQRRVAQIDVHSNVDGVAVFIDGQSVGTTPLSKPIEVNEGKRSISIESSVHGTKQRIVMVAGGERQSVAVDFELTPLLAPRQSVQRPSRPAGDEHGRWANLGANFWATGASALLLGVGAGLTGYLALQARNDRRAELNQRGTTAADLDRAERRTKNLALATDLMAGGAIVCAGIATTLLVLHDGSNGGTSVAVSPDQVWLHGSF
jgi:hypothetical protein